ncbi:hypothetical protein PENCOP_c013G03443 [Penicillium coprophilum]|uniref:Uncharacterized protein n=1 Tax=Penicillium coprophilum TaxID=36646 RepID=A0A1V6UAC0_9EURO|nr:hypothetical protein PENCOP_c013G03443 [Penicillium coprophilum]
MPITLTTAAHPPRKWETPRVCTAKELFARSCRKDQRQSRKLIQSSFPRNTFRESHVSASQHGFVCAVFNAYSYYHDLIIRPEDALFFILTQFILVVNSDAEELRFLFVSHEGKKELEVITVGTIDGVDLGVSVLQMTRLIEKNVVEDEELRAWVMPTFSTTTKSDNVVAAILMMGALQKYFSYKMSICCGTPSVTLLDEREDWAQIVKKLDKLHQVGDESARFAQLLRPVLNNFVASFDNPDSPEILDF